MSRRVDRAPEGLGYRGMTLGIMSVFSFLWLAPGALLWQAKCRGRHYPNVVVGLMFGNH